ncbi:FK506-binding protein 5-like [Lineus longissimus]|uniref:FK506-binding protein 5-like n=1 Tax=Lineus longissimus TaxID=88925 RepID=UPI00315CEFCE
MVNKTKIGDRLQADLSCSSDEEYTNKVSAPPIVKPCVEHVETEYEEYDDDDDDDGGDYEDNDERYDNDEPNTDDREFLASDNDDEETGYPTSDDENVRVPTTRKRNTMKYTESDVSEHSSTEDSEAYSDDDIVELICDPADEEEEEEDDVDDKDSNSSIKSQWRPRTNKKDKNSRSPDNKMTWDDWCAADDDDNESSGDERRKSRSPSPPPPPHPPPPPPQRPVKKEPKFKKRDRRPSGVKETQHNPNVVREAPVAYLTENKPVNKKQQVNVTKTKDNKDKQQQLPKSSVKKQKRSPPPAAAATTTAIIGETSVRKNKKKDKKNAASGTDVNGDSITAIPATTKKRKANDSCDNDMTAITDTDTVSVLPPKKKRNSAKKSTVTTTKTTNTPTVQTNEIATKANPTTTSSSGHANEEGGDEDEKLLAKAPFCDIVKMFKDLHCKEYTTSTTTTTTTKQSQVTTGSGNGHNSTFHAIFTVHYRKSEDQRDWERFLSIVNNDSNIDVVYYTQRRQAITKKPSKRKQQKPASMTLAVVSVFNPLSSDALKNVASRIQAQFVIFTAEANMLQHVDVINVVGESTMSATVNGPLHGDEMVCLLNTNLACGKDSETNQQQQQQQQLQQQQQKLIHNLIERIEELERKLK